MKKTIERQCRYIEKMEKEHRRRAVRFARLRANIFRPQILVFAILVLILGCISGKMFEVPFPGNDCNPALVTLWNYSIMLLIFTISILMSLIILTAPPLHANKIEAGLEHIGLIDRYGLWPALISSHRLKDTNIKRLTFYSRGLAKDVWEKRQTAIEDVLNIHWIDTPQYGGRRNNNRNYIVLTVASGTEIKREEPLYDDEL